MRTARVSRNVWKYSAWRGEPGQDPDLDVSQAGVTEQARGAAAGMEVPAGSRVDVGDLGQQQLPGGMRRVGCPGRAVGLLERDDAAGPGEPGHLGDDVLRAGDVQQQHALVHEVEGIGRQAGAGRVGPHGLDGQAVLSRQLAGDGQQPRLDVQPDHPPAVADPGAQLGQDAEHAAADVDHARAGRDADAVEQVGGVGPEELGLGQ